MWLRWAKGRQGTGYDKLCVWSFWRTDCYILRYTVGAHLPIHRDPVENRRHFRLNIELKKAQSGGRFICLYPIFRVGRLAIFRSDLAEHCMTKVTKGTRYVLSFGVAI